MKSVEINGATFAIHALKPRVAMRLDKQLLEVLAGVIGNAGIGLDSGLSGIGEQGIGDLFTGITTSLRAMTDEKFDSFMVVLLSCVQVSRPGQPATEVNRETFDTALAGMRPIDLYQLAFEVMKENAFTPFAMAERFNIGDLVREMFMSTEGDENDQNDGSDSATSESSPQS